MSRVAQEFSRYLAVTTEAEAWGVVVRAGGLIINEPGEVYPPTGHPEDHAFAWERGRVLGVAQVVLITSGEGEFNTQPQGGAPQRVSAGDVIWITPGCWHRYRPSVTTGWTEQWVELGGRVLDSLIEAEVLPRECRVLRPARSDELSAILGGLHLALQDRAGGDKPAELAASGMRLLGLLAEPSSPQGGTRLERAVKRAERVLGERLTESASMPALARELGVNYAGFRREFRRRTGVAPRQYLLRLRLERAQRLVGATPFTLEAIAEQLGFSSAFHLSAAFKKHFGVSPSVWRNGTGGRRSDAS